MIPRRAALSAAALPPLGLLAALVVVSGRPAGPGIVGPPVAGTVAFAGSLPETTVSTGTPSADPAWVEQVSATTGIPARAVRAYADAALTLAREQPSCHLGWNTLAGIGSVESDHGRHGGSSIDPDGVDRPAVFGPALDGSAGNLALPDSDGGALDGDATGDRAAGPMQFIPTTWRAWARSATGAVADVQDIDDATLTAAAYLCADERDLANPDGWRTAIASYNEPVEYANDVADAANRYAAEAGS